MEKLKKDKNLNLNGEIRVPIQKLKVRGETLMDFLKNS